jgi:succinylglutamic semialdehyde dehydrogenase
MKNIYINGEWISGEGMIRENRNPATGELMPSMYEASFSQANEAIHAAKEAFRQWRRYTVAERTVYLKRYEALLRLHQEKIAGLISEETGKPHWEAITEVNSAIGKIQISIEAYEKRTGVVKITQAPIATEFQHKPHGVLIVLGPYNFPLHLPNGHIVPALLAGNTLVFKPSEYTPRLGLMLADLIDQAGFPRGVFNLVLGGRGIGEALLDHPDIQGVLFTGSYLTGKSIHEKFAGKVDKIIALEMGGNNPLVVWEANNIDAVCRHIILSAYISAGQRCSCARRLIISKDKTGDNLLRHLTQLLTQLHIGAPIEHSEVFMGPVISESAALNLLSIQEKLRKQGGTILNEMTQLKENTGLLSAGLIDVTSIENLPDEEYFGPFLQVIRVDTFSEAIEIANQTKYGLSAGLFSDNLNLFREFYDTINAGVINFNRPLTGASSQAPFGGVGLSGNHRPSAFYAADYCAYPVASLCCETIENPEISISMHDA